MAIQVKFFSDGDNWTETRAKCDYCAAVLEPPSVLENEMWAQSNVTGDAERAGWKKLLVGNLETLVCTAHIAEEPLPANRLAH